MSFLILLLQEVNGVESINDQPHTVRNHLTSRSGRAVAIKRWFQKVMYRKATLESNHETDSISKSYSTSVSLIQMVKRSELGLQLPSKSNNVIGLDFGTSTLVVSYVTPTNPEPRVVRILEEDIDYYTPTVLLIDDNNKVEIGNEALLRYTDLDVDNFKHITFFEKVKLELQHNEVYTFTKYQVRIQYIYTCCSCNIIINV